MPIVLREYDIGDIVWFVDVRDSSLHTGEIISATVHAFATLTDTITKVTYKIYDGDDYFVVMQEHIAATPEEAAIILDGQLDNYEC